MLLTQHKNLSVNTRLTVHVEVYVRTVTSDFLIKFFFLNMQYHASILTVIQEYDTFFT